MPNFALERAAGAATGRIVVGIDEAGRGPLAGPVVAAAVWLDCRRLPRSLRRDIDDSKRLEPAERRRLHAALTSEAQIGLGLADPGEIDRWNILRATLMAMRRAVDALGLAPDTVLVDGPTPPPLSCPIECVVGGDGRSLSIAAASIVAKVVRDSIMVSLDAFFPGYGWERNAGYGTPEHLIALARQGISPLHRRSFQPVRTHLPITCASISS